MTKVNNIDTIIEAMEFDREIKDNSLSKKKVGTELTNPEIGDFIEIELPSGKQIAIITMVDTGIDEFIRCSMVWQFDDLECYAHPFYTQVGNGFSAIQGHTFPILKYRCRNTGFAQGCNDPDLDDFLSEEWEASDGSEFADTDTEEYQEWMKDLTELTQLVALETWSVIPE